MYSSSSSSNNYNSSNNSLSNNTSSNNYSPNNTPSNNTSSNGSIYNPLQSSLNSVSNYYADGINNKIALSEIKALGSVNMYSCNFGNATTNKIDRIPKGTIGMWAKNYLPYNWAVCDGTNGTPDLRDKFVVNPNSGTNNNANNNTYDLSYNVTYPYNLDKSMVYKQGDTSKGITSTKINVNNLPDHAHNCLQPPSQYNNNVCAMIDPYKIIPQQNNVVVKGYKFAEKPINNATSFYGSSNQNSISLMPPYYRLIYIMKIK